jgi:DnaJ family protein C protein 30
MSFHPDKNKGSEEAAQKFRDITEAYEVLGNLRLRKLYDKGILHTAGPQYAQDAEETTHDNESKFYKSREQRSRAPPPTGRTPIYDFDEWTHMHYGTSFARREAAKARYARKIGKNISDRHFLYSELIFLATVFILTSVSLSYIKHQSYDKVDESVKNDDTDYQPDSLPIGK